MGRARGGDGRAKSGAPRRPRVRELPNSRIWPVERVNVAEMVWGRGFIGPGSPELVLALVRPLGLDSTKTMLELGAGLGAAAQTIAETTGAAVTGLNGDPLLARLGMDRMLEAGLGETLSISLYDPERLTLDRRFDAILARECFFTVLRKDELFDALQTGLKPRGRLLFTDYVMKHSGGGGRIIDSWRHGEPQMPHPWTIAQVVERLQNQHFDVRTAEDITDQHRSQILAGWERLTEILPHRRLEPVIQELMLREGEIWMRRIAALDTGDVRLYKFHALGPDREEAQPAVRAVQAAMQKAAK